MRVMRIVVIVCASYEDNDKNAENDGGDALPLLSHMATGLSVYIYTSVDPCISMHGSQWARSQRGLVVVLSDGGLSGISVRVGKS